MLRRRRQALSVFGVLTLLTALVVAPATAAPPERVEVGDFFLITLDVEHEQVVFWNITREDFCAWEASNFEGPPPVLADVSAQFVVTGNGVLIALFRGTAPLELWRLDEDADLSGPCQDTDAQSAPWAVGTASLTFTDNDVEVSGSRTNSFGGALRGTVTDADGTAWHFSAAARFLITRDGEFRVVVENFTLARRG